MSGGAEAQPQLFNTAALPVYPSNMGVAAPYWNDTNGNGHTNVNPDDNNEDWANPESFQIIACGMDGKYGNAALVLGTAVARLYPTGTFYDTVDLADDDNVTNFCDSARLEDAKP
jgi:hypothetical protein